MVNIEEIFVECRGVAIGYQDQSTASVVVKNNLSLKAYGGEMVAVIGQNGIGKSTLLKTIAGFQQPLSGERLIHSKPASAYHSDELAREMSFVSTEIVRVANLTVRELVGLGRFPYTNWFGHLGEEDHRIVAEAIRQVGLLGYEEKPVNRISDGERQRAMIARALAQDTRIIVLDEPTAFLDISNKYEIVRILHRLAEEQGKCIIFSTHDLNTALSMADRIWLMLNELVVEGVPEEVAAQGYFESLFASNLHLFFDAEKGDFRIRKESRGIILLDAFGKEQFYATKALERIGFEVVDSSALSDLRIRQQTLPYTISVFFGEDGWNIKYGNHILRPGTLESLCREIKKINLLPQS